MTKKTSVFYVVPIFLQLVFCSYGLAQNIDSTVQTLTDQSAAPALQTPSQEIPSGLQVPDGVKIENLTQEQTKAVQTELSKSGGILTPEAIEALKKNPEFKNINPEEIIKGRDLLEKRNVGSKDKNHVQERKQEASNSLFERYMSSVSNPDETLPLLPFGYDIFQNASLTPPQDMPVTADYVIGPGDEVNIFVWGRVSGQYNLTVSRDGTILFPNIGPISVAGMTFEEMKKFLTKKAKAIIGVEIDITMGRLKSIQVFVLGEVKMPGAYTVSSLSTITNALLFSGGPSSIGSLRRITLKRNNKIIINLDMYDLLLKGDKSKDLRLQNGDLIFVPTVGPLVGVSGNVKRPAIYELKNTAGLETVLDIAGGIIPTAYTQLIQVERVEKNERKVVIDINMKDGSIASNFKIQDADLIKVSSILDTDVNAVYLNGNVKRPGKYELKGMMRLKDIIHDEGDLLKETYFEYGLIKRAVPPSSEIQLIPFNVGEMLFNASAADNIELRPQDSIYIFSKWFFNDKPKISIEGEVRCTTKSSNCEFELQKNMTVKDLIFMAEGLKKEAYLEEFELYRWNPADKEISLLRFNLSKALEDSEPDNVRLQDQDRVVIHSIREKTPVQYVTINGSVSRPSSYGYAANMTLRDLVFAAGGLLESAYQDEAELATANIEEGSSYHIKYRKINLRKALAGDQEHNLRLNPYDIVFIKKIPEWNETSYVEIKGEVMFPGKYIIKKSEKLSSLIERAGGYRPGAYLKGAVFTRESVRQLQQENINAAIERLEQAFLSHSTTSIEGALSSEAAAQQKAANEQKKALIAKLKSVSAKGRLTLKLTDPAALKKTHFDIELEDKDTLVIPPIQNSISVMGSVFNQNSFIHDPGNDVNSYIKLAGGFTKDADKSAVYVLKVDGSAEGKSQEGWGFMSRKLDAGDTIVVPQELEKTAWMKEIKDVTQILYQIAVTAGVLIVAF